MDRSEERIYGEKGTTKSTGATTITACEEMIRSYHKQKIKIITDSQASLNVLESIKSRSKTVKNMWTPWHVLVNTIKLDKRRLKQRRKYLLRREHEINL